MNQALNFIQSLWMRDIEITLKDSGKLFIQPSASLTDADREFIKAHRDELIELVRNGEQLGHLESGWQPCAALPERVMLVRNGRLIDSAIFRSEAGAKAFFSLVKDSGYPMNQAFHAACAIEDGERDRVKLESLLTMEAKK